MLHQEALSEQQAGAEELAALRSQLEGQQRTLKELIIGLAWAAINSRLGRLINSRGRVINSGVWAALSTPVMQGPDWHCNSRQLYELQGRPAY